jgi:hypothetical protein
LLGFPLGAGVSADVIDYSLLVGLLSLSGW